MSKETANIPKCIGTDCPIKKGCAHFRVQGNGNLTIWNRVPYDHSTGECESWLPVKPPIKGLVVRRQ